jgi:predicted MFS family arabinose efflux permease
VTPTAPEKPPEPRRLLASPDFRRAYLASAIGQLGDAFQFVAIMWLAVESAGPAGVIAVRVGNSLPALLFGLHGGIAADRQDRRRTMIAADLVRAALLVPVAVAGLTGTLELWALIPAGFALSTATSYFTPAFGSLLPSLVGRASVQQANGLIAATNNIVSVAGLALAAALLSVISAGSFFAVNAGSFLVSAALLLRVRARRAARVVEDTEESQLRTGISGLGVRPGLGAAVAMLGVGMTVMTGVWTVGIAELAHSRLGHGASGLSLLLSATALGTISATSFLARRPVRRKVFTSCLCWCLLLPGYLVLAFADLLPAALLGTFVVGAASGAAFVLVSTAAQESVPEDVLGRAMGIVFLGNVGSKPIGLLLIAPLYLLFPSPVMFVAGGSVVFASALLAATSVDAATRRARAAAATA